MTQGKRAGLSAAQKPLLQFLGRNDFAGRLQKDDQHLEWLTGEFQFQAALAQLSGPKVNFESRKANDLSVLDRFVHRCLP
jgi:hypothetical protein